MTLTMITNVVDIKIMIIPKAATWPQRESAAKFKICTASTSVPGRDNTTDKVSSLKNIEAINIQADTTPGMINGSTIRLRVPKNPAPHTREDSSNS